MPKFCFTFDVDWAPDFVLEDMINILESQKVNATFFITHKTNILSGLEYIEKGIHPHIRNIDQADSDINQLKEIYPEAISSRSHTLLDSGAVNRALNQNGISIKSHYHLYLQNNIQVLKMPYEFELYEVPIYFIEGCYIYSYNGKDKFSAKSLDLVSPGLKVFNFHPIHIYLNTENISRYEQAKPYLKDKARLDKSINPGTGVRNLFIELLNHVSALQIHTYKVKDIVGNCNAER